jgi:hypothetical protein
MLIPTTYKSLKLTDNFENAFPDKLIPHGNIDKRKTRLGITYTHFHAKRHQIAALPSVPIIIDSVEEYPELQIFQITKGISVEHIAAELQSGKEFIRLATTPESFWKIIEAAKSIGKLQ